MTKTIRLCASILSVLALVFVSAPVLAETGSGSGDSSQVKATTSETEHAKIAAQQAAAKARVCGIKKNVVGKAEGRVGKRGQGRLEAITKITTKVEDYIQTKNLSVTNYDSLVATINAKKTVAQTAVDTVNAEVGSIGSVNCQGGDGKTQVETFKKDMRAQQDALKAYREAVKALVAATKVAKTSAGGAQQ
jgi:uncharacterized coiled-coil DUF342 family protein